MEERGLKRFCRLNREFIIRQFYFETEANNSGCVRNVVKSWGALLIFSSMVHGSELEQKSLRSPTCFVLACQTIIYAHVRMAAFLVYAIMINEM